MLDRITTYLSFLEHARCPVRGFHNFLSYQRDWLDAGGTGDCQGQAVRALAEVLGSNLPDGYRALARELIDSVLPTLADLRSLRAQAYVILAWGHLWAAGVNDIEPLESIARSAAQRLVECYRRSERSDWQWFESRMTYANAVLPHALFVAAQMLAERRFCRRGRNIVCISRPRNHAGRLFFGRSAIAIGIRMANTNRCTINSRSKPLTMADAALAAFSLLRDEKYLTIFCRAHDWFHGQQQPETVVGRCRIRRLLRRPATVRSESKSGSRIDAGSFVDRSPQRGNATRGERYTGSRKLQTRLSSS